MKNIDARMKILKALLILLFISIIVYFTSRAVFIYFAEYGRFEKMLALLFFASEAFVMMHAFGYFISIYRTNVKKKEILELEKYELKDFPAVAVLIPERHEPQAVLDDTLASCYNMDYPAKTIYLLDDSSDEKFMKEAEEVAAKYGAKLFRRTKPRHDAKAGIVNDCLETLQDKYVLVFDADQNPMPDFLRKIIPLLEKNPRLAFVQTPQFYSNLEVNKVAFCSNMQQSVFYEYICEGKSTQQAMICCGTNVVFRRKALAEVGGLDESTVTEDFATSFRMCLKKWDSLYYNHVHTFGMGPEDLGSYLRQQNRWAMGNVGVFRVILAHFFKNPFAMSPAQWFEYIITGSYYLIGWSYLFLVLCPILYIFFNVPSFFMNPVVYGLSFIPYFVLSLAIFYESMSYRNYRMKDLLRGQLLAFITLPIYVRASTLGLLGVKGTFQVTGKGGTNRISYVSLWPQITFWALCLAGITWGLNRYACELTIAMIINVVWTAYHFALFSGIFYFNEMDSKLTSCKSLKNRLLFEYQIFKEPHNIDRLGDKIWKVSFSTFIPERLDKGVTIMCKLAEKGKAAIIFDGIVMESAEKKARKGYKTAIGVLTITEDDKAKLIKAMK